MKILQKLKREKNRTPWRVWKTAHLCVHLPPSLKTIRRKCEAKIHKVIPGKQVVHFKTCVKWAFPFNVNMIGFSPQTQTAGPISRHGTYLTHVGCKRTAKDVTISGGDHQYFLSLSIRGFWGKGERWKQKRERAEGEKCLTEMLLLEPSTPTQHDSIPSNQNHFRSLGCQLHMSKSSPKINLTLRSGLAPVLVLLRFRFFLKPPMRSFRILVM